MISLLPQGMMQDDYSNDNLMIEAAVSHHKMTVTIAIVAFVEQGQEQQRAFAVLAMISDFGLPSLLDLLTLTALLIFHDFFLSIMGNNFRGLQPEKAPNMEKGQEAVMQQLVDDYFSGQNSIFLAPRFRRHLRMGRPLFVRIVNELTAHNNFFQKNRQTLVENSVLQYDNIDGIVMRSIELSFSSI